MITLVLYIIILFYASAYDRKYMIVENRIHFVLFLLTIISGNMNLEKLIGATVITIPLLLLTLYKNGIGGGDIKYLFFNTLFLGFSAAYTGIVAGLSVAVLYALFTRNRSGKSKYQRKIPLVPFLSTGFLLSILLRATVT